MSVPLLHVVTGDAQARRPGFPDIAMELLETWGADLALHLRLREAAAARTFELALQLAGAAERVGGWCVVNERLDVALAAGAQAAQLGRSALPVAAARKVLRSARTASEAAGGGAGGPLIGASVHGPVEARQAVEDGADYLVLGTIFASRTHPGVRPHGSAIVERCRNLGIPVVAIGGIDAERAAELRRRGASGVAVVRAVWNEADPVAAAGRLIRAWMNG